MSSVIINNFHRGSQRVSVLSAWKNFTRNSDSRVFFSSTLTPFALINDVNDLSYYHLIRQKRGIRRGSRKRTFTQTMFPVGDIDHEKRTKKERKKTRRLLISDPFSFFFFFRFRWLRNTNTVEYGTRVEDLVFLGVHGWFHVWHPRALIVIFFLSIL